MLRRYHTAEASYSVHYIFLMDHGMPTVGTAAKVVSYQCFERFALTRLLPFDFYFSMKQAEAKEPVLFLHHDCHQSPKSISMP